MLRFQRNLFFNNIVISTNGVSPFFALSFGKQYISLQGRHAVAPFISDQCLKAGRRHPEGLLASLSFLFTLNSLLQTGSCWALQKCPSEEVIQLNPNCQDTPWSSTIGEAKASYSTHTGTLSFQASYGKMLTLQLLPKTVFWPLPYVTMCKTMTYSHGIT